MISQVVHRGSVRVFQPGAFKALAAIAASPSQVIWELVEDGVDAKATSVWVVLEANRILVVDNGHGMLPHMLPDEYEMINSFLEDLQANKLPPSDTIADILELASEASKKSIQWMAEFAAFSAKPSEKDERVRGSKGIGVIGVRQIADSGVWRTRPAKRLAAQFWEPGDPEAKNPPVFRYEPPKTRELERFGMGYQVTVSEEPLLDPHGQTLQSGTIVEMTELHQGVNIPSASLLGDYLGKRLGEDLRRDQVKLFVIDRATAEGRKAPGGKEYTVQPPRYKGHLVAQERPYVPVAQQSFEVELYYDPRGKGLRPELRRQGIFCRALTDVRELDVYPLNTGKINGFVEFPIVSEIIAPWDVSKTIPLESEARTGWIKTMRDLLIAVNSRIWQMEERAKQDSVSRISKELADAALEAMAEDPVYQDLIVGAPKTGARYQGPRGTTGVKASDRVEAIVYDENHRGVADITVELLKGSKKLGRLDTKQSGLVSFGRLEQGEYTVRIIVPQKMRVQGRTSAKIKVTEEKPGARAIFRLVTGLPRPAIQPRFKRTLGIWLHPMSDPDQPYSITYLDKGRLEINLEYAPMRQAADEKDYEFQRTLGSFFVALALTEYGLEGDKSFLFQNAGRLAGSMLQRAREKSRAGR